MTTSSTPTSTPEPALLSRGPDALPCPVGELLWMAVVAVALRVLVAAAVRWIGHVPLGTFSINGDGFDYQSYAQAVVDRAAVLTEYQKRLFVGLPLVLAALSKLGIPLTWAGFVASWGGAAVAAPLAAQLGGRRIGWAMTCLTPSYVLVSSYTSSESLLLALSLAGLVMAVRFDRPVIGGVLLGMAGVVRPVACFAVLGYLVYASMGNRRGRAVMVAAASLGVVAAGLAWSHSFTGSALTSARVYASDPQAYGGQMFGWPFKSLIFTPRVSRVPVAKLALIYAHVAVVIPACFVLARRALAHRPGSPLDPLMAVWLVGNTLFLLCVGGKWGFHEFPRFICWALPPLLWAVRPLLPTRRLTWGVVGAGSLLVALFLALRNT